MSSTASLRAAIYVDFDQIFGALAESDWTAAEQFATAPLKWLRFFEAGRHDTVASGGAIPRRRILVRKCYLNPGGWILHRGERAWFSRYRAYFTRAGFEVVDCPPLTGRGKNAADIVMVMDIIDALEHSTTFEEFIILSGDADFTPVLSRLRAHDRRTAIFADSRTAPAYKAVTDLVVDLEDFVEDALGVLEEGTDIETKISVPANQDSATTSVPMAEISTRVRSYLQGKGQVPIEDLTRPVFQRFPQFGAKSDWFGHGTLRNLVDAVAMSEPDVRIDKADPARWQISVQEGSLPDELAQPAGDEPAPDDVVQLRSQIAEFIRRKLATGSAGLPLPELRELVQMEFPQTTKGWPGAQSFRDLLDQLRESGIAVRDQGLGIVYPLPAEMVALVSRLSTVIGTPSLDPGQLSSLLRLVSQAVVEAPANDAEHSILAMSARIKRKLSQAGTSVSRSDINFVLRSIEDRDPGWREHPEKISSIFLSAIEELCDDARLELSSEEGSLLRQWITGNDGAACPTSGRDLQASEEDNQAPQGVGQ